MKFNKSHFFTLVFGLVVGASGMFAVNKANMTSQDRVSNYQASHRNADAKRVFTQKDAKNNDRVVKTQKHRDDTFAQIDRMRDQMRKQMDQMMGSAFSGASVFDHATGLDGGVEISQGEDDQYKYVKIFGEGVDKDSLDIQIKDGMISISGRVEKKTGDGQGFSSTSISSFSQRFNTPSGVIEDDVDFDSKDDSVILKFKKI